MTLIAPLSAQGVGWVQRTTPGGPSARAHAGMTWDAARGRVLLACGAIPGSIAFDDTWKWDGRTWFEHFGVPGPLPRTEAAAAHDPARGATILFGGVNDTLRREFDDTWEWSGSAWVERSRMISRAKVNQVVRAIRRWWSGLALPR